MSAMELKTSRLTKCMVGLATGEDREYRIPMNAFSLEGWGKTVTSHERLKESYYILQEYWARRDG